MTEQEVVNLMRLSKSESQWNYNADYVKKTHGGYYPGFWYSAIIQSGEAGRIMAGFDCSPEIGIEAQ